MEGLTRFVSRKVQLARILAGPNLSPKLSSLIGLYQNIFDAHDIEDEISRPNSLVLS